MAGRRSKYTPELIKEICEAIKEGSTQDDAARIAGIAVSTFYAYMKQSEFSEAVEKAHAEFKKTQVKAIKAAGYKTNKGGQWQANAWLLERKYPDEFGQRLTLKVSPEDYDLLRKMGFNGPADAWQRLMDNARREWADAHADS